MEPGRVVLITGATGAMGSVIGQAVAKTSVRVAPRGQRVVALQKPGHQLSLPDDRVFLQPADLSHTDDVQALIHTVANRWGGIHVLLNTAGCWRGARWSVDFTEPECDATLDLNLRSAFSLK